MKTNLLKLLPDVLSHTIEDFFFFFFKKEDGFNIHTIKDKQ